MTLPLEGIRIADFSWFGAGPIGTLPLAWYGAEVIRIESEARLALRRSQPARPGSTGSDVSGYYNNFNSDKLSFTLNMQHEQALDIALALISKSDVVVENYQPGTFEKWGLTYDRMLAVKPDIIFLRMPMAGTDGPHRDFGGFGALMTAVTGINYLAGFPDLPPAGLGTSYPDFVINPGHQAIAVLAALRHRRLTGRGQYIELAQLESTTSTIGPALLEYAVNGDMPCRNGNRDDRAAPHGVFPCLSRPYPPRLPGIEDEGMAGPYIEVEDRWCAIAVFTDGHWEALKNVMGNPPWADDEQFSTFLRRKEHEDELERLLSEWTQDKEAEDIAERLQAVGVPAGAVQSGEDIVDRDIHLQDRQYYQYLDHPKTGRSTYDGSGFHLSETPRGPVRPAPLLGEHTFYVAHEILGFSSDEIADLVAKQVLY